MPKLNGMELREKAHNNEDLRLKSIPYLFFSTSAEQAHVIDAYSRSNQGFFIKPHSMQKFKVTIKKIVEYWQECVSPNYIKILNNLKANKLKNETVLKSCRANPQNRMPTKDKDNTILLIFAMLHLHLQQ